MLYIQYDQTFRRQIISDKINETLARVKKRAEHSAMVFEEKRQEDLKSKVSTFVTDVTIDQEGTVRTYFNDEKIPVIGYSDFASVWTVALYKRLIPLILKNISQMGLFKKLVMGLSLAFSGKIVAEWFELIFEMHAVLLNEENYTPCVKEIRRVLKGKADQRIIDGFTAIIEYDSAYRYPLQDILPLISKEDFEKNWRKELKRVAEIAFKRANPEDSVKFKNIYRMGILYFTFNRKMLNNLKQFIREIDLSKVAPSYEDIYWMYYLATYNCFGRNKNERDLLRLNYI